MADSPPKHCTSESPNKHRQSDGQPAEISNNTTQPQKMATIPRSITNNKVWIKHEYNQFVVFSHWSKYVKLTSFILFRRFVILDWCKFGISPNPSHFENELTNGFKPKKSSGVLSHCLRNKFTIYDFSFYLQWAVLLSKVISLFCVKNVAFIFERILPFFCPKNRKKENCLYLWRNRKI